MTTERYDNQTQAALVAAAGRLETGQTFDPHQTATPAAVVVPSAVPEAVH